MEATIVHLGLCRDSEWKLLLRIDTGNKGANVGVQRDMWGAMGIMSRYIRMCRL